MTAPGQGGLPVEDPSLVAPPGLSRDLRARLGLPPEPPQQHESISADLVPRARDRISLRASAISALTVVAASVLLWAILGSATDLASTIPALAGIGFQAACTAVLWWWFGKDRR